jgi:hypothetical protein
MSMRMSKLVKGIMRVIAANISSPRPNSGGCSTSWCSPSCASLENKSDSLMSRCCSSSGTSNSEGLIPTSGFEASNGRCFFDFPFGISSVRVESNKHVRGAGDHSQPPENLYAPLQSGSSLENNLRFRTSMSSDSEDDREALLQALQAHGQQFLSAFGEHAKQLQSLSGQSYAESSKSGLGKRKASIESGSDDSDSDPSGEGEEDSDDDDDEEWQGIDDSPPRPHQKSYIEVDYSKSLQKSSEKLPKPSKKAFMVRISLLHGKF